jgi:hypothetical protein
LRPKPTRNSDSAKSVAKLKAALQFTALPVGDEKDGVSAGLVDVKNALRNPNYNYLRTNVGGEREYKRVEYDKSSWCSAELAFRTPTGEVERIKTDNIWRIVQISVSGVIAGLYI